MTECDLCGEEKEVRLHFVAYYGDDGWYERDEWLCEECHRWRVKTGIYTIDEDW